METITPRIHLVLFFCEFRTGHFGAGSHISVLLPFLKSQQGLNLTIVKTDVRNQKEVSVRMEEGVQVISIPQPENKLYLHAEDTPLQNKYAERISDIISPILTLQEPFILWVNSIDYLRVVEHLKSRFPGAQLLYVHHAWSWKCYLNITDAVFGRLWKSTDKQISSPAFEYTGYQQELANRADLTVTVTKQAADFFHDILEIPQHKIRMIYNGVIELPGKRPATDSIREKYGFRENEQLILFSGRVKTEKGLAGVINAFKNVALVYDNVRLLVAGFGDFADFIEMARPCWSKIVFTGELSPEEMMEIYSISCIGILPSLFEQCSFTAIEMRFHRLALIVSDVDGLGEVFEDGKDALVIPVTLDADGVRKLDDKPITDALFRLLGDPVLRNQLAVNGLAKARALFSGADMQKAYLQVIRSLQENARVVSTDALASEAIAGKEFDQSVY